MPAIGWIIVILAAAMIIGSLMFLRDSANMRIPPDKLEKIRQRKAELDAQEKDEDN
ncbi:MULTISPECIES: DUF2897 family protein [Marinobacter]|uniref:DUF2897 family protein n=1 Tax=Marinobacter suaedae TaxID=3057675 RepID=A0ABT8VZD6_9GAMM|nr:MULTISPECIES: DUF2897 family protein [unclassified Marinobacter]MBZ2169507.1 DUF2897 family protein [Marinobacter sp. F4216]MDO3721341.1 DUF2897 family protein [Marinobacter sp. chi1]